MLSTHRGARLRLAVLIAVPATAVSALTIRVLGDEPIVRCPQEGESVVRVRGPQESTYERTDLRDGTTVVARRARWVGTESTAVDLRDVDELCLSGGRIRGTWPSDTSWDEMHGHSAVRVESPRAVVEDLRIDGYGDSVVFLFDSPEFTVRRVHVTDSRDDCIENDWLHTGTVEDSLLDGCYNAFSSRTYDSQEDVDDGDDHVLTVRDSMVRLQPMERTYKDEDPRPGTAGFFKWDESAPRLSLHGNVFRADLEPSVVGLGLPEDKLESCSDNVMVWLGEGPFPEPLPSCFEVTDDVSVWDDAVAEWHERFSRR